MRVYEWTITTKSLFFKLRSLMANMPQTTLARTVQFRKKVRHIRYFYKLLINLQTDQLSTNYL